MRRLVDITIERMGEKGDGLSESRAYPRTLPSENITLAGKVIAASPDRVSAFCPVFETCGGCKLQHWREAPYREWKTALLASALKARGIESEIKHLIDAHGAGRRRVSLHVREIAGQWRAGFMAEGSHDLVPIDVCPILVPKLQNAPQIAAKFGTIFGDCDVAVAQVDNGLDVAIKASRKLAEKAIAQFAPMMNNFNIMRIAVNGETRAQQAVPLVHMGKALVELPIGTFLQATAQGEDTLGTLIVGYAKKSKRVLDLFSGAGPFTFRLAEKCTVHAIDSDKAAIAALQAAARKIQGLKPITAQVLDLFHNPYTPMDFKDYDAAVLDPPRAGAEAQCRNMAKSTLRRVIYVSCDVQSFARDAGILVGGGFKLVEATPVDQFKYSPHLEVVALFTRS